MVSYELKPTFENLKKSILGDYVGRNDGIVNFIKFLDAIDGNIAIALNDNWGNGKTFFVKQVQMVLQSYNESNRDLSDIKNFIGQKIDNYQFKNYLPVNYDAWSNDNDDDPILSIIFRMLESIEDLEDYEVKDQSWWDRLTSGLELISTTFGGPRIKNFFDSIKGENILKEIKKSKEIDEILNNIFEIVLEKQPEGTRIIFFIDELDRCCPNYAVRMLERIKHYFIHEKIVFVLSINEIELQHTIKRHYGNDFNADQYLHRFFDFMLPLPMGDKRKFYETINFESSTVRFKIADIIIRKYNFSLRETIRYLSYLKVALLKKYNTEFHTENLFYFEVLAPFLIGLNIHDSNKFHDFINGANMEPFLKVMEGENVDWYCQVLLDKSNETFKDTETNDKTFVALSDKFEPVYKCLFGKIESNSAHSVKVTDCEIEAVHKKLIMEIVSLKYAYINIDGEKNGID